MDFKAPLDEASKTAGLGRSRPGGARSDTRCRLN